MMHRLWKRVARIEHADDLLFQHPSVDYGFCYPVNRPCLDCRLLTFRLEALVAFLYTRLRKGW